MFDRSKTSLCLRWEFIPFPLPFYSTDAFIKNLCDELLVRPFTVVLETSVLFGLRLPLFLMSASCRQC